MSVAGYEVRVDTTAMILHARAWGVWKPSEATAYLREFTAAVRELAALGQPWCVLADVREYPAQSPETQEVLLATMREAQKFGMKRAANVVAAVVTQLQVTRLTKTAANNFAFFHDIESALAWLAEAGSSR